MYPSAPPMQSQDPKFQQGQYGNAKPAPFYGAPTAQQNISTATGQYGLPPATVPSSLGATPSMMMNPSSYNQTTTTASSSTMPSNMGSYQQPLHPPSAGGFPAPSSYGQIPQPVLSNIQGSWFGQYYQQLSPQEMSNLQQWFLSMDRDRSGTITANELATLQVGGILIGNQLAKILVKVFDRDMNGSLDFIEYAILHKFLVTMHAAFVQADVDRNGYLDINEIFQALQSAGFALSYSTIHDICMKFDYVMGKGLPLSSFLLVCSHLAAVRSLFEWNDKARMGQVTLNYDQLAGITIHLLP